MISKLRDILKIDDPLVLEIGCYKGQDTKKFLDIFPKIGIFCFEPDPKNVQWFRQLVGNDPRCKLFQTVVSHIDGDTIFYESFGPSDEPLGDLGSFERKASGSIRKPTFHLTVHPWCRFGSGMKVKSVRLDTWSKDNGVDQIDLIWADVNGAERDLINGAQQTLKRTKFLYTEFTTGRELYEGGLTKDQIKGLLPNFKEMLINKNNILLRNTEIL